MSIQHVAAVLYHMPELKRGPAAFALIAIADSADRESGWSWSITLGAIQRATRLSERTAQRALRELETGGYILTDYRPGGTPRYRVLFDFNGTRKPENVLYQKAKAEISTPPATVTPPRKRGGRQADTGGRQADTGGRHSGAPNNESVFSPSSIQKSDLKNRGRGIKKVPPADATHTDQAAIDAERNRVLAELARRKLQAECPVAPC